MDFTKYNFISIEQQKIMLLMYLDDKKRMDYHAQASHGIYKSERAFNNAMKNLCCQRIIKRLNYNGYYDTYELIYNGAFYVKNIILK